MAKGKVRVLIQSSENGEKEYVIFSDDLGDPQDGYVITGCSIDSDTIIDNNLPDGFPLNYALKRN
jgi:hypothetical protein